MSIGKTLKNFMLVRKVDPEKEPFAVEWLKDNQERNAFDPDIMSYPHLQVLAAHTNGRTHVVMPVHDVAMLESVGTNPDSSTQEVTQGMLELVKATAVLASTSGCREMLFLSSDAVTDAGAKRCGFEQLQCKVWRMKLK